MSQVAKWIFPAAGGKDGIIGTAKAVVGVITGNAGLIMDGFRQVAGAGRKAEAQARQASILTLQIGEVPRQAVIGVACTAGSLGDVFNFGGQYGTDKVTRCILLADHAIDGIEGFWISDVYYPWVGDGLQAAFSNKLSFHFRNALPEGHDPPLHVQQNGGWTATDRLAGVAHIWIDWYVDDKVWPQGHPEIRFVLRGLRVYDPRRDPALGYTGPEPQTWEDRSTHRFSQNAKLLRYAYTRGIFAEGHQGDPAYLLIGRGLTAEEAPPEAVIPDANLCDELVDGVARYAANGVLSASQPFIEVDGMFAAAMAGVIVQREGTVDVEAGQAKAVSAFITDADLVEKEKVGFARFLGDNDGGRLNTFIGRYIEPLLGFKDHSAPVRRDLADIAKDGGPRETTISLALVTEVKQVDRILEINRLLSRLERRGNVVLPPRFAGLEEGDWVAWQSARRHKGATVRYRIEAYREPETWRKYLTLREIASSVFGVPDPIEDTTIPPPPPVVVDALAMTGVIAEAITLPGETSVLPAVRFSWDTPTDAAVLAIRAEVRRVGETDAAPTRIDDVVKGQANVTNGVGPDQALECRLVPIGDPSRPVLASNWITVSTSTIVAGDLSPESPVRVAVTEITDRLVGVDAVAAANAAAVAGLQQTYGDTVSSAANAAAAAAALAEAVQAKADALVAKDGAVEARTDTLQARSDTLTARGQAEAFRDQTVAGAATATGAAATATEQAGLSVNARDASQGYADAALQSRNQASGFKTDAEAAAAVSTAQKIEAVAALNAMGRQNLVARQNVSSAADVIEVASAGVSGWGFFMLGSGGDVLRSISVGPLKKATPYSVSFLARRAGTAPAQLHVDLYPDTLPEAVFDVTSNTWNRYTWEGLSSASDDMLGYVGLRFFSTLPSDNAFEITDIKLEEGPSATAYTPSPRDAAAGARAAAESASNAAVSETLSGLNAAASQADRIGAQTARGQAEGFRNQTVQALEDAKAQAAIATDQAGLSVGSATLAGQKADAAAGSASLASTKADEAGASAQASNAAKVAAEIARDGANGSAAASATNAFQALAYRNQADEFASSSSGSANAAGTAAGQAQAYRDQSASSAANANAASVSSGVSATTAQRAAESTLPSTFEENGRYFGTVTGPGLALGDINYQVFFPTIGGIGKVVSRDGFAEYGTKGVIALKPGRKHRVRSRGRIVQNGPNDTHQWVLGFQIYDANGSVLNQWWTEFSNIKRHADGWYDIGGSEPTTEQLQAHAPGATYIRPYVLQGWGASVYPGSISEVAFLRYEDVTESAASANSAAAALSSQAGADAAASRASISANLAASVGANASVVNNSRFLNWPAGQPRPTGWDDWANANGTPNLGPVDGWNGRRPVRMQYVSSMQDLGMKQVISGFRGAGAYNLEVEIAIPWGGPTGTGFQGAGVLIQCMDANFNYLGDGGVLRFFQDPDTGGNVAGSGSGDGKIYRFSKRINLAPNTASIQLYLMSRWTGFGPAGANEAKTLDWYSCALSSASESDRAVPALAASLSVTAAVAADAQTRLSSARFEVIAAAGSDPAQLLIRADASGSLAALVATSLRFSNVIGGQIVEVMKLVGGSVYISGKLFLGALGQIELDPSIPAIIWKSGGRKLLIGTSLPDNLIAWFGVQTMALVDMTKGNAAFFLSSDAPGIGGLNLRTNTIQQASLGGQSLSPGANNLMPVNFSYTVNGAAFVITLDITHTGSGGYAASGQIISANSDGSDEVVLLPFFGVAADGQQGRQIDMKIANSNRNGPRKLFVRLNYAAGPITLNTATFTAIHLG